MSSPQQPISLRTTEAAPGDKEVADLAQQLHEGRFDGTRDYLSRTRVTGDWQDRVYVLERVAPKASIDALNSKCAAEPEAADLFLIRCAHFCELAGTMRGAGTADQVGSARFQNSAACAKAAMADLTKNVQFDAEDPTAHALILKPLTIFTQTELMQKAFQKATALAPDFVPVYRSMTNVLSERWGGSHKASVEFARSAMTMGSHGSDMAACLFWAHSLVRTHYLNFDKDVRAAKLYATNPEVTNELNAALDAWLAPPYTPRRSSIPFLRYASEWYRVTMDVDRQKRVIALTGEELKLSAPASVSRPPSSSKSGGLLNWIMGGKR
jgi:hypothetical protein